jgi:hypothetical protein
MNDAIDHPKVPAGKVAADRDKREAVVLVRVAQPSDEDFDLSHVLATGCFPL